MIQDPDAGEVWCYRTPEPGLTLAASKVGVSYWFENEADEPTLDVEVGDDCKDHGGAFVCSCHWCTAYLKHLELCD